MKLYSSGQVADLLGIHRDKVVSAIRAGAPEASLKLGRRKAFTRDDIVSLHAWLTAHGTTVTFPTLDEIDHLQSSPA